MPSTRELSVEELREESERSRDALASTVGELRDTVGDTAAEIKTLISPAHIKKEIRNYVREERESVVQSIQRRAQENPLQMAAVGAAVAYPVWSLLRAIPTPLLLIGAGLFLTSKRGHQSTKEIKAKVDDMVHQGTEKVSDLADAVRSDVEDRLAGARYGAEELRDTVTSAAGAVTNKVRSVFHDAADTAKGAVGGGVGSLVPELAVTWAKSYVTLKADCAKAFPAVSPARAIPNKIRIVLRVIMLSLRRWVRISVKVLPRKRESRQ
jgi:ElaB/YqjD/DUF883 family membrane-anchored ribosome-binding protein